MVGIGVEGLAGDGDREVGDRGGLVAQAAVAEAAGVVETRVTRRQRQGLGVVGEGGREAPGQAMGHRPVTPGVEVVRGQRDGAVEVGQRPVSVPKLPAQA
jgi:hypothetical protein